jgi:hypothetical protein
VELLAKDGPPPLLLLIAVIVGVTMFIWSRLRTSTHNAMLRSVAHKLGGTLVEGGLFSESSLDLNLDRRSARVEFWGGSKNSSPYTKVIVRVAGGSPGVLHILEEGFGQSFLKLFGAQDLEVGDSLFDSQYVLKATPPTLVQSLFRPERREEGIRIVRRLKNHTSPTFDLDGQTVSVQVRQYLRQESDLLRLIECAKEFTAFVLEPVAPAGIVFGEVKTLSGADCPVCGTAMTAHTVRCVACRTPHHPECWSYMGRCSTYACKGTRAA